MKILVENNFALNQDGTINGAVPGTGTQLLDAAFSY